MTSKTVNIETPMATTSATTTAITTLPESVVVIIILPLGSAVNKLKICYYHIIMGNLSLTCCTRAYENWIDFKLHNKSSIFSIDISNCC